MDIAQRQSAIEQCGDTISRNTIGVRASRDETETMAARAPLHTPSPDDTPPVLRVAVSDAVASICAGSQERRAVSPDVEQMTPRVDARAPYADRLAPSGAAVSSAQTARSMHVDAVECTPNCRKTEQSEAAQDTKRTPWEWGRHQNAHTRTNHPWRHVVRACGHECTGK